MQETEEAERSRKSSKTLINTFEFTTGMNLQLFRKLVNSIFKQWLSVFVSPDVTGSCDRKVFTVLSGCSYRLVMVIFTCGIACKSTLFSKDVFFTIILSFSTASGVGKVSEYVGEYLFVCERSRATSHQDRI